MPQVDQLDFHPIHHPASRKALRRIGCDLSAKDRMNTVQELADEAFADLLRRHHRPVTLKEALSASAGQQSREKHRKARRKSTHWPPSPRVLRIRFANSISSGVTAFASRASANCSTTA